MLNICNSGRDRAGWGTKQEASCWKPKGEDFFKEIPLNILDSYENRTDNVFWMKTTTFQALNVFLFPDQGKDPKYEGGVKCHDENAGGEEKLM